jgi:HD superfamily phosphohydrolase
MAGKIPPGEEMKNRIVEVLETQLKDRFDRITYLASGSTAYIFKARQSDILNIVRAIKVFKPDVQEKEPYYGLFVNEVTNMARLTHENVLQILSAGEAKTSLLGKSSSSLKYYIMEYLDDAKELDKYMHERLKREDVLNLFRQALLGMEYLHSNQIVHMDLKPKNIFVSKHGVLKIADFGFSIRRGANLDKKVMVRGTLRKWPKKLQEIAEATRQGSDTGREYALLPRREIRGIIDIHMMSLVFDEILRKKPGAFSLGDAQNIRLIIDRMNQDSPIGPKYERPRDIFSDLLKLDRHFIPVAGIPELTSCACPRNIRIPELEGVPISDRVAVLIDHPLYQRLRKSLQTGLCSMVYPGALHSRFEHSLGVYKRTTKYVAALLADRRTPYFIQTMKEKDILILLASALLHDIGQHTFAHSFEEQSDIASPHEDMARSIIKGEQDKAFHGLPKSKYTVADILKKQWHLTGDDINKVIYLVSRRRQSHGNYPPHLSILKSIIDGAIDADKLDYLQRDSHHCGVPYGKFVDEDRLLQSLTVVTDGEDPSIAITEKGRICAELFLSCRSNMFSEVYWHHAVRAFSGMLNLALIELTESKKLTKVTTGALRNAVYTGAYEDTLYLIYEYGPASSKDIIDLLRKRIDYKRLYVADYRNDKELYRKLTSIKYDKGEPTFGHFLNALFKELNTLFKQHYPGYYYLLDIPKPGRHELGDVGIFREGSERPESMMAVSQLWQNSKEDWELWTRKIRLFIHPDAYGESVAPDGRRFRKPIYDILRRITETTGLIS